MPETSYSHTFSAVRIFAGTKCLNRLADVVVREGVTRMLICCGATLARDPEGLARLQSSLTGIDHLVFDRVTPHSTVPSVTDGVDMAREAGVDGILAFGGGSAVVSARAIAIGLAEDAPFRDLATRTEGGRVISPRLENPKCPVFVVQTTPNTASVKVGTAVMDPETRRRLPMFDPKTRTRALFLNPAFLDATPVPVLRIAALQTLSQTIEGLESGTADPFALAALRHAMDLTAEALPRLGTPGAGVALALSHAAALTGEATDHTGGAPSPPRCRIPSPRCSTCRPATWSARSCRIPSASTPPPAGPSWSVPSAPTPPRAAAPCSRRRAARCACATRACPRSPRRRCTISS